MNEAHAQPLNDAHAQLRRGGELHAAGRLEDALRSFEQALRLAPGDARAVSACASMLLELGLPQTAWHLASSHRTSLLAVPDGATNLAIVAEACGLLQEARVAYESALAGDPAHLRALNNLALLDAREARWNDALGRANACVRLLPAESGPLLLRIDVLTAARRLDEALAEADAGLAKFAQEPGLQLRRTLALALLGRWQAAQDSLRAMGAQGPRSLARFLGRPSEEAGALDLADLCVRHSADALAECDWRVLEPLAALARALTEHARAQAVPHDWRELLAIAPLAGVPEADLLALRATTVTTLAAQAARLGSAMPPAPAQPAHARARIGWLLGTGAGEADLAALASLLARHDASRFLFHVYLPGDLPAPGAVLDELRRHAASVTSLAYLTPLEAAGRIRLDRLEALVDASETLAPQLEPVLHSRVAGVQLQWTGTFQRQMPPWDYVLGDPFTHPRELPAQRFGQVARLPVIAWPAAPSAPPRASQAAGVGARRDAGLPSDALVLCAMATPRQIEPFSFGLWMRVLQALPQAVLWLPGLAAAAQARLAGEAVARGVPARRLAFGAPASPDALRAQLPAADLFLDCARLNAAAGLHDALWAGVPGVSLAAPAGMAGRRGAALLAAAGLADCIAASEEAYLALAVGLGADAERLAALRARLATAHAPLFDTAARMREWQDALQTMALRARAGQPPQSFDVPAAPG